MGHMERLVEMFVQSARYGDGAEPSTLSPVPQDGGHLDAEGIEHGIAAIWKMLTSEDGIRMGTDPSATFVCLAMALEEKPLLQAGAARCYEKALELMEAKRKRLRITEGSWEKAVVLQQLGTVCLRQGQPEVGAKWLEESLVECSEVEGHPREAVLFGGAFNTKQTRLDFIGTVEKFTAKAYHDMGDNVRAQQHYEEVQRLSRMQSCDAVERTEAQNEAKASQSSVGTSKPSNEAPPNAPKALWAATQVEEKRLSEYRFVDEGPTVLLVLDLNDHLGIGVEASNAVDSLAQFKVNCQDQSVDVRVRLMRENGKVCQFQLLLDPLVHEVIPEDTVPKLKGRDGKRRLEVKLFKRDKKIEWRMGDIVKQHIKPKPSAADAKAKPKSQAQGTMLNPLSADEIAKLPRPGGANTDNRPSSWQGPSREAPVLLHKQELPPPKSTDNRPSSAVKQEPAKKKAPEEESLAPSKIQAASTTTSANETPQAPKPTTLPPWVERVEERSLPSGGLELDVHLGSEAGEGVGMADLELEGDDVAGLRICLHGNSSPLVLSIQQGTDTTALRAKWRRKTRVLELRLP